MLQKRIEEKAVNSSKTIEEAAMKICGYGFYDYNGISREVIIKYMKLGAEFAKKGKS